MIHFADWIGYWAARRPHWPAVIDHDRARPYSYAQLNTMANGMLYRLHEDYQLQPGDCIAMLTENCIENLVLFSACQKSGLVLLPLNYRLSNPELEAILRDAAPRLCIIQDELCEGGQLPLPPEAQAHIPVVDLEEIRDITEDLARRPELRGARSRVSQARPEDAILLLYTSGSSGKPKGVIYSYQMMFWNAINTWMRLDITSTDRTVNWMPPFHTAGWNILVTPFLHHGATVIQQSRFDPAISLRTLEQYQATVFMAVPTMLRRMADEPYFHEVNLRPARYLIAGGESMPPDLIARWARKGVPVRQGYGLTEAGPNITSLPQEEAESRPGSIGTPNFYLQWALMDEQKGILHQQAGKLGELYLAGPIVTPGYWRQPPGAHLVEAQGQRWLPTGDLVQLSNDGYLYVLDRKANQFISGGENVFPSEVERTLNLHPSISEVAVVGCPDPEWGEVGVAFVVARPHIKIDENTLRRHAATRLAGFKIPKRFHFVEEIPKTDSGKVDRKRLMSFSAL